MLNEAEGVTKQSLIYLARIGLGLLLLALAITTALSLPLVGEGGIRWLLVAGLLLAAAAVVPMVHHFYRRSDELQQRLHLQACGATLPLLFSLFAGIGVLQANQWLPSFNSLWAMLLVLAVWAVNLMLSDRRYRT